MSGHRASPSRDGAIRMRTRSGSSGRDQAASQPPPAAADQYATFTCNASTSAAKGSPRLALATPKNASRVTDRTVTFSGRVTGASTVLTIELYLVRKGAHVGLGTLSRTCDGSFSGSMLAPLGVTGPIAFRATAADGDGKHPTTRRRTLDLDPAAVQ